MCFRKLFSSMSGTNRNSSEATGPTGPVSPLDDTKESNPVLDTEPATETTPSDPTVVSDAPNEAPETVESSPAEEDSDNGHSGNDNPGDGASVDPIETDTNHTTIPKVEKPIEEKAIPNPMCEVEYCYSLGDVIGQEEVVSVATSDDNGDLYFDASDLSIKGVALTSRNYWMEIELPAKVVRLKCYINNNPRLLWKDIPSDQSVKPDKDYQAWLSPGLDMIAVSYRGRLHANLGTNRDDDFYLGKVGKFALSIVADGAGSAPLSSTGSKVFCKEAGTHFAELVNAKYDELLKEIAGSLQSPADEFSTNMRLLSMLYDILPAAALHGRHALMKLAADKQVPLKHYHTTALLSMSAQVDDGVWFCAAFQIGDGITAALTDQHLELLGKCDSGNFPGETVFVTSNDVFDDSKSLLGRIHCCLCKQTPILISMTDGIADSYFKNVRLDDVSRWQQLVADITDDKGKLKPADVICDWLNYYIEQEHDDRTMTVVMYK